MLEVNAFDTMLGQLRESGQLNSGSVLENLAQRQKNASAFMQALSNANAASGNVDKKLTDIDVEAAGAVATNDIAATSESLTKPPSNENRAIGTTSNEPILTSPPPTVLGAASNLFEQNALFVNSIAESRAIFPEQQNVVDSTLRSNYTYTTSKDPVNNTLWGLEDGLRRAVDSYDAVLANAKGGMSRAVASKDGRPVYVSREQEIQLASEKVQITRQNFETHKAFLNDPIARSKAEIAFQITRGYPSQGGPELSPQDQLVVKEERMRRGLGV